MKPTHLLSVILVFSAQMVFCQAITPDLQDASKWRMFNRTSTPFTEEGKKGIRLNEVEGNGLMILQGSNFSNGTIELDIKGRNKLQQSFVGISFHVKDAATYDAIYFRPFNFKADDALRRSHAVQYISMPDYDWEKLRTSFPGKYENGINPAPSADDWFHAKIVVDGKHISVYVNNQLQPCLEVDKLNVNSSGGIALWTGNNADGSFANLVITAGKAVAK